MQEKLIDVSTWNGNIDWDKVYKSGVRYAMIRSSFGVENPNQIDNKFVRNIENAIKVGIKCGIYHYSYARSVAEAKKEADFCLKTIKNYKIDLPVAFDIEDSSQTNLGKDALTSIVIAFCDRIKSAGYMPMLYCNPSWKTLLQALLLLSAIESSLLAIHRCYTVIQVGLIAIFIKIS
ncbi:glycosyl hydrolase family 25 [Clostridium sp. CAG:352]|nr:glycosyl hydrolase family 25 [Clostridium sp. CAG:352]